ncbi:hypothetical protein [Adlercreutzia sp. ZJ141]|uniref:hypothetical protein n=1 Tax=Adlercreutzia sp. ZJ141 TaxID=2709406 RepID=UPI0013EA4423|nr:hypothetical protein [Adlercreutzia sp. ZJ141]
MGYRSEVRIATTKEGYGQMCDRIELASAGFSTYPLMGPGRRPEFYEEDSDCVVFGWDSIKWYDGFLADVTNVTDALDKLEEDGVPYEFCRIGESWEDIEFRTVGNNDELTMHVEPSVYIEVL